MKHKIEEGTEIYVHAELQKKSFDPESGKPLSKPFIHITTPIEFDNFLANRMGHKVNQIFHIPEGYEIPKPKPIDKDEASKNEKKAYKLAMKDYDDLVSKLPNPGSKPGGNDDSPLTVMTKELKRFTVPEIDAVLVGLDLPVEGNKNEKIAAILEKEFPVGEE